MVDKEKQVIAFIDANKKKPFFEGAVLTRFGDVGEYYLQLIQTEAKFQKLRNEITREQSRYQHFSEEELGVIAYIDAHKNVLYFEDAVREVFGDLGEHCLYLVQTDPSLKPLREEILEEKKRFAEHQERNVIAFIEQHKNNPYFERMVIDAFGDLGRHCLHLVQTDPRFKHLRDEIAHLKKQKQYFR